MRPRLLFQLFLFVFLLGQETLAQRSAFFFSTVRVEEESSFDADYQAVLDRGTALGYTLPSAGQQILQNQLVLDLKAAGIWTLLDVFYVFATDGDSDYATLNWKNPAVFQCAKVNSPTFTVNQGFKGNQTTSYLNTGWTPNLDGVKFQQDNASIGMWINSDAADGGLCDAGTSDGSFNRGTAIFSRNGSNQGAVRLNQLNAVSSGSIFSTSIGFYYGERINSNTVNVYKNGVYQFTDNTVSQGKSSYPLFIGCHNNAGMFANGSPRQFGCLFVGSSFVEGLQDDFYNSWNAYLTSL